MIADSNLAILIYTTVCIAIFLASLACIGFDYKNEQGKSGGCFIALILLIGFNTLISHHALVFGLSLVAGFSGWTCAAILRYVFGVPVLREKHPIASTKPVTDGA